ncbi:ribosomal-protein-alanine N-acetyltransferase [Salimicrobium halophilum]|uniref:Ribosomal-protein-alanine N-acetyltransferase n=1 Tax=Salimicrobium halophilum TaxID=86666 RepID=A0A1G8RG14_9BACI|nr:ribosomal-protein-alanine N-acetyltransferase [Salimicrobium halophilum]
MSQSDFEEVKNLYTDENVRRFLGGPRRTFTLDEFADDVDAEQSWHWTVRKAGTNEFIGMISLATHHSGKDTEVSYQFLPKWWKKGYAKETVARVVTFAFEDLNLERVVAETQTANRPSCLLLERLGMEVIDNYERFGADQSLYSISDNRHF